ncbi:MAG: hypothetical protein GC168_03030 [Candidatus Hydrogenedens sp.]|nr:hypothetical protein [Candidatus Hydrogenedens sp.]
MRRILFTLCVLAAGTAVLGGCATAAKDTTGFSIQKEIVVEQPFEEAWVNVKNVLVASDMMVYTRDKRGSFEAYDGPTNPIPYIRNRRTKYNVDLIATSNTQTHIQLQATRQVYGSSLTTYPDWHDRKTTDGEMLDELIAAIGGSASGVIEAAPEAPMGEAAPAEATEAPAEEVVVEEI